MNEQERMQFFYEMFHSSLSRLGPGTDAATVQAVKVVLSAAGRSEARIGGEWPRVLDLGCGTGPQTMVLARHFDGPILAVDHHQPNLDALRRRAEAEGLGGRIATCLHDMNTLELDDGSFDVVWSEGALFCMGFREGLGKCRPWLAEGGFLAVTELCWLRPDPPAECRRFIEGAYPVITDLDGNLGAMKACGYTVLDHFVLPESAWVDEFYDPLERRLQTLRGQCAGDVEKLQMIELIQREVDVYRKYPGYYGYIFYILRR